MIYRYPDLSCVKPIYLAPYPVVDYNLLMISLAVLLEAKLSGNV